MTYKTKIIGKEDLKALIDFFVKNENSPFFDPFPLNKETAIDIVNSKNRNIYYAIYYKGKIVGFEMLRWYKDFKTPTLGLLVDEDARGLGLGKVIYSHLFTEVQRMGCDDIVAIVDKENAISMHIAKKLGMSEIDKNQLFLEGHYDFKAYSKKNPNKLILIKKL